MNSALEGAQDGPSSMLRPADTCLTAPGFCGEMALENGDRG